MGGTESFGNAGQSFDDALTMAVEPVAVRGLPKVLTSGVDSGMSTSVEQYLGRPHLWQSSNFSTTDTPALALNLFPIIYRVLDFDYYRSKLKGYAGLRATLVFTIQVNANRMQQGRYIFAHVPSCGAESSPNWATTTLVAHRFSKVQVTQLPHVEIDVNCDTKVQLKVPYVSDTLYFPLDSLVTSTLPAYGDIGAVFMYPYSPLVAPTGPTTAGYTIFTHFEDIELIGAATYQGDVTEVEKKQAAKPGGIISGPLMKVSRASSILGEIPYMSSLAKTASWAANIASRSAAAFGFAAPTMSEVTTKMTPFPMSDMNSIDVPRQAIFMGHSANNSIAVVPGLSYTDLDEMSFAYIKKKFAYIDHFTWSVAPGSVHGTVLANYQVGPSYWSKTYVDDGTTIVCRTPAAYLANIMAVWRGQVHYRFKFVKTEFHSGRLEIVFNPLVSTNSLDPGVSDTNESYMYRQIVDLRNCNEFTFTVPYVSPYPWLHNNEASGRIYVRVLDPLVAPANVSSSITILVEVAGADDMEFAGTAVNNNTFCFPISFQGDVHMVDYQGDSPCVVDGFQPVDPVDSLLYSSLCIGEKITSLKQLALKYNRIRLYGGSDNPNSVDSYVTGCYPFSSNFSHNASLTATTQNSADMFTNLSQIYGFYRGGIRLRLCGVPSEIATGYNDICYNVSQSNYYVFPAINEQDVTWISTTDPGQGFKQPDNPSLTNFAIFLQSSTGGIDISVSNYSSRVVRATSWSKFLFDYTGSQTAIPNFTSRIPDAQRIDVRYGGAKWQTQWYRSIADDGHFGCFISIPPMYQ